MTKLGAIVTTPNQSPLAVITVTYSPGEYLGSFLDSLPSACARGTNVVLADNGSTERAEVDFLDTGGNIGYGAGMNAGARFARERGGVDEEFFLISNPDVTFTPGSIDQLIECARQWPDAAAVGPRIVEPDGSNFMYLEDVDLGDRLTRAGYQNIFCPEAVISHAKGHSTQAHAGAMLRAHHNSAYRFQADRHPAWWQAPLRGALWLGLRVRGLIASASARS